MENLQCTGKTSLRQESYNVTVEHAGVQMYYTHLVDMNRLRFLDQRTLLHTYEYTIEYTITHLGNNRTGQDHPAVVKNVTKHVAKFATAERLFNKITQTIRTGLQF